MCVSVCADCYDLEMMMVEMKVKMLLEERHDQTGKDEFGDDEEEEGRGRDNRRV